MSQRQDVIRIRILADDSANPGFGVEHGFAAWIEVAGRRILFDTGQGTTLAQNARRLGVALESTEFLVLSHGHYDHTGGVPHVVERAPGVQVCLHSNAMGSRYSIRAGVPKAIGIPEPSRSALERLGPDRLCWATRPFDLAPGVGVTGPIPRLTCFEDTGGPFFLDRDGKEPDPITDDMALWMHTRKGLVVVVGCSHAGLVNTLRQVQNMSGGHGIHAVLGGFHLRESGEGRLDRTMEALTELEVDMIVPCHCTGERAIERLVLRFGERVRRGAAGEVYDFSAI